MDKFFDGPEEEELDTPPKPSRPVDVKPYLFIVQDDIPNLED